MYEDTRFHEPDRPLPAASVSGEDPSEPVLEAELVPSAVPVPPPPHPGFWWSLLWCLGYLVVTQGIPVIFFMVVLIAALVLTPGALRQARPNNPQALLNSPLVSQILAPAMLLGQVLSIAGSWAVIRLVVGRDWRRLLAWRTPSINHLVLALVGLPGLMFLSVGIDSIVKSYLPSFINLEQTMELFGSWPWPVSVLIIGVGPGIGEELWCRGFLGRGLVARHGVLVGVLLTSLLFGLLHLEPRQVVYAAAMGVLLHLSYLATRSLLVPIALHISNNSLSVLAAQLTPHRGLDTPAEQIPWQVFALAALLVAAVGWALFKSRARLVDLPSADPFHWRPAYPGVAHAPRDSTTIVVHPRPDAASWMIVALAAAAFVLSVYAAISTPTSTS